jgi:hypothetical protein
VPGNPWGWENSSCKYGCESSKYTSQPERHRCYLHPLQLPRARGQSAASLIASVLQQLVEDRGEVSQAIKELHASHIRKRTTLSLAEYSEILQEEVRQFSAVYVMADA